MRADGKLYYINQDVIVLCKIALRDATTYTRSNNMKNTLPESGLVRLPQVLAVIPVSKSTWWAGVKSQRFPQPVYHLGPRITAWKVEDIRALIEQEG